MCKKIYIQKIEEHKKSIFEFWRFANKSEALGLNAGEEVKKEVKENTLKKTFKYEEDFDELGIEIDKKYFDIASERINYTGQQTTIEDFINE